MLDHGFWQRELGGAADIVGRKLTVAGEAYTVVGVLAAVVVWGMIALKLAQVREIWLVFALMQPVAALAFAFDGLLIGAGDTRFLAAAMVVAGSSLSAAADAIVAVRFVRRRSAKRNMLTR